MLEFGILYYTATKSASRCLTIDLIVQVPSTKWIGLKNIFLLLLLLLLTISFKKHKEKKNKKNTQTQTNNK